MLSLLTRVLACAILANAGSNRPSLSRGLRHNDDSPENIHHPRRLRLKPRIEDSSSRPGSRFLSRAQGHAAPWSGLHLFTPRVLKGDGEACTSNDQCSSGHCSGGDENEAKEEKGYEEEVEDENEEQGEEEKEQEQEQVVYS